MDIATQIVYYYSPELPVVIPTLTFSFSPLKHGGPWGRTSVAIHLGYETRREPGAYGYIT
jgi:hypothetical protein